jgi:hypothetical protein
MTISEYLAATALVALILWAVLGLLMQESQRLGFLYVAAVSRRFQSVCIAFAHFSHKT